MYNNIENIVYRMFQNYYDISVNVNVSSRNIRQQRDVSSRYISILMENIFDSSNNETYQNLFDSSNQITNSDISLVAYRFFPSYYYSPTNYVYNNSFYRQNYAFIDLINTKLQSNKTTW